MRFGAIVLGTLGALLALATAWFAAGSGAVATRLVVLAAVSCLVGVLGLGLAAVGRPRAGALLLAEAPIGLSFAVGQHALIPGGLLLFAAALAWLARPGGGRRRRTAMRLG